MIINGLGEKAIYSVEFFRIKHHAAAVDNKPFFAGHLLDDGMFDLTKIELPFYSNDIFNFTFGLFLNYLINARIRNFEFF